MSDEILSNNESPGTAGVETVYANIEALMETAHVDLVYGDAIEKDETTIIPTAEVFALMGFGVGYGTGSSPKETEEEGEEPAARGGGGGGGGGGRTFSRPVAVIIADPQGVRVEPVVDITKIALAALTAAGFMLATMMRMANPRRALKELKRGH